MQSTAHLRSWKSFELSGRVGQHVAIGITTEAVQPPGPRTHRMSETIRGSEPSCSRREGTSQQPTASRLQARFPSRCRSGELMMMFHSDLS